MTPAPAPGRVGVVLMAYGTPRHPDDIAEYYTDIRRGRPPTPEALADLTARYAAIGGLSPLAEITEAQRAAVQAALDRLDPGRFEVALGFKHAVPKVEDTACAIASSGVERVVALTLAPHFSSASVGEYLARVRAGVAAAATGSPVAEIESWATEPAFVEFTAGALERARAAVAERTSGPVAVLFTAHSLPERVIAAGDPYPSELRATAGAVAARLGLADDEWQLAWQSAGRTPEPWIGPDILAAIDELAERGAGGVVVCACGFVADHLEVLYDLDVEAASRAASRGIEFERTACVNDDAVVMGALAQRVRAAAT